MYDQIVSLLVSAGYFRARIKGISPFDVVFVLHILLLTVLTRVFDV